MKRSEMFVGGISLLDESPIVKELRENEELSRKEQEGAENTRELHKAVLEELIEMSPEGRVSESDSEDDLMFKLEENGDHDSKIPSSSIVVESKAGEILEAIRSKASSR